MQKKLLFSLLLFAVFFATAPPAIYLFAKSESISLEQKEAVYELPYSGILPDNPLYFVKEARDGIIQVATRDSIRKAQFYLLLSDKKAAAALSLAQKGKEQLALETLQEAEEDFARIPALLEESKKQGVSPSKDFIDKLFQSNNKHHEVITDVMKQIPQGGIDKIKDLLTLNEKINTDLKKIH